MAANIGFMVMKSRGWVTAKKEVPHDPEEYLSVHQEINNLRSAIRWMNGHPLASRYHLDQLQADYEFVTAQEG